MTDPELITKCRQCLDYIIAAKSKQAEEANKAAQSLLDMLAQEEAMAESKKRTKQRQKEKKKAKKNAKKQMYIIILNVYFFINYRQPVNDIKDLVEDDDIAEKEEHKENTEQVKL